MMKFSLQTLCILFFVTLLHVIVIASLSTGAGNAIWGDGQPGGWKLADESEPESEVTGLVAVEDSEPEAGEKAETPIAEPTTSPDLEGGFPPLRQNEAMPPSEAVAEKGDSQTSSTKARDAISDEASYSGRVDQPDLEKVMATDMVSDAKKRSTPPRFESIEDKPAAEPQEIRATPAKETVTAKGNREFRALRPVATSG